MKSFKLRQSLLTLATVLAICFNASALDYVSFVLDQNGKAFILYLNVQVDKAIELSIQDESGTILWDDNFQAKGKVAKKFSLDQLPDGDYFAQVSDEMKTITQPLTIRKGIANILEKDRTIQYKPMVFQKDRRLDINWYTAGEKAVITLTDWDGNVLLKESQEKNATLHKRFNLEQIQAGEYTLSLATSKDIYFEKVICK